MMWTVFNAKNYCERAKVRGLKYFGARDFLIKIGEWDAEADAPAGSKAAIAFHKAQKAQKSNKATEK